LAVLSPVGESITMKVYIVGVLADAFGGAEIAAAVQGQGAGQYYRIAPNNTTNGVTNLIAVCCLAMTNKVEIELTFDANNNVASAKFDYWSVPVP
jgi:hypothetical protein